MRPRYPWMILVGALFPFILAGPAASQTGTLQVDTTADWPGGSGHGTSDLRSSGQPMALVTGIQPCTNPPSPMVAWWPLDEPIPANAADIVNSHDGTHRNGPAPVTGKVAGALRFDGVDDVVEVPHHPDLDMGIGDLSIDLWLRSEDTHGVAILVDKRTLDASGVRGYSLHMYNGGLSMQLADASGSSTICGPSVTSSCTNWNSPAFIADGQWHHIAVTVDRDDPLGLKFYVDGVNVASYDPAGRSGSLDNSGPLRMGTGSFHTQLIFEGELDEVELFDYALSADEIALLYEADSSGKCKSRVSANWEVLICNDDELSKEGVVTICNDSTEDKDFDLLFEPLPGGADSRCPNDGPDQYFLPGPPQQAVPPSVSLQVPARTCIDVPFVAQAPGSPVGYSCYDAIVTDPASGVEVHDIGSIVRGIDVCLTRRIPVLALPPFGAGTVNFPLVNTSGAPLTTLYQVKAMPQDGGMEDSLLSLNGLPVGTMAEGTMSFGVDESAEISVDVSLAGSLGLTIEDLVLYIDTGDGEFRSIVSTQVRSGTPFLFGDGFESGNVSRWSAHFP